MSMPVGVGHPSLINGASSSSSRSMSLSKVLGAGASSFSFTLHSGFVGITGRMVFKCLSLSFSTASSLIFCALIHWILLLWLGMRPGGHQRGARAIPKAVVLKAFFCPEAGANEWSGLGNRTVWFGGLHELVSAYVTVSAFISGMLFCSATTSSRLFSVSGFASPLAEDSLLSPIFC
jgi:hypothetical protein